MTYTVAGMDALIVQLEQVRHMRIFQIAREFVKTHVMYEYDLNYEPAWLHHVDEKNRIYFRKLCFDLRELILTTLLDPDPERPGYFILDLAVLDELELLGYQIETDANYKEGKALRFWSEELGPRPGPDHELKIIHP